MTFSSNNKTELGIDLPDIRECREMACTGMYYGLLELLCDYAGKRKWKSTDFRLEWQHGWCVKDRQLIHPTMVTLSRTEPSGRMFMVARRDEAEYLRIHGYNAVAAGLPIGYVNVGEIERKSRSLLLMPCHSLEYLEAPSKFEDTLERFTVHFDHYETVTACLHPACVLHGYWIRELERRRIPWFTGASAYDQNGLKRMATVFSRFDTVLSNGIGSHIVYAHYFGARATITGPHPVIPREQLMKEPFYSANPEILDRSEFMNENYWRKLFPFLYVAPEMSKCEQKWAREQIGSDNILGPGAIRQILRRHKAQIIDRSKNPENPRRWLCSVAETIKKILT